MGRPTGMGSETGLKRGALSVSPIPTQVVSNEEFAPHPQTVAQARIDSWSPPLPIG